MNTKHKVSLKLLLKTKINKKHKISKNIIIADKIKALGLTSETFFL